MLGPCGCFSFSPSAFSSPSRSSLLKVAPLKIDNDASNFTKSWQWLITASMAVTLKYSFLVLANLCPLCVMQHCAIGLFWMKAVSYKQVIDFLLELKPMRDLGSIIIFWNHESLSLRLERGKITRGLFLKEWLLWLAFVWRERKQSLLSPFCLASISHLLVSNDEAMCRTKFQSICTSSASILKISRYKNNGQRG